MTDQDHLTELRARIGNERAARLPNHLARLAWSEGQLVAHQVGCLRALLAHATKHSRFHARRLEGVDVGQVGLSDLADLPIMTKSDMMANFDDAVTDHRLDRRLVEDHIAASVREPSLLLGEYVCLASGGSSGQRGVFAQSAAEYADFNASLMRKSAARTFSTGGPPPTGLVIGVVAAASPIHASGFGATASSGHAHLVPVPATNPLAEIVDRLNKLQPHAVMGYSRKLVELAGEQEAGRLHITPRAVTATGELLTVEERAIISAAFGVLVIDQFACTEGLVGHSEPGGAVLTFATDMCIVEPVDDDNRPVGHGTPSAKVLITNLYNFTQPLIRYELSDRFVCHPSEQGQLCATVEGRADDTFYYGALAVPSYVVRTVMVETPAVIEYQVRQTTRGLHIDAVAHDELDSVALAASLESGLCLAGLPDPEVTVRTVEAIERLRDTAKAQRFIALASGDVSR